MRRLMQHLTGHSATAALAIAALAVVVAATASTVVTRPADRPPAGTPTDAADRRIGMTVTPERVGSSTPRAAAATALTHIADAAAASPADPPRQRFEYVELKIWDPDTDPTNAAPAGLGIGAGGGSVGEWERPRWSHTWTTGRSSSRHLWLTSDGPGCRIEADQTSDEPLPFDGPPPTHLQALRRWLLHEPDRPHQIQVGTYPDLLAQIGELYATRYVPRDVRRAILHLLANQPDLAVNVGVRDRVGRVGVAVTGIYQPPISQARAKTLIFDPMLGHLLAVHSRPVQPGTPAEAGVDGPTDAGVGRPGDAYTAYLARAYTPDWNTPTVRCPR